MTRNWYNGIPVVCDLGITRYCKFTIIPENFIFADTGESERSRIQHSRKLFEQIEFT